MADVSVIIPCYNGERFIRATVESALRQDDPPREVIVIDDGSTDGGAGIVERIAAAEPRVRLIRQANAGESKARNVGMDAAGGRFLAFLDADDLWLPHKLTAQLRAMAQFPDAACIHGDAFNFENDIDDRGGEVTEPSKDNPDIRDLIDHHCVTPSAAMVRREVIGSRGVRFAEHVRHAEDMLFFADVRLAGPIRRVAQPLVAKRIHAGQQSGQRWHRLYSLESRLQWVRDHRDELGESLAAELDQMLGRRMVELLEDRYWRRQFEGFDEARRRVGRWQPQLLGASFIGSRRVYPRWVYRVKDAVSRRGAARG